MKTEHVYITEYTSPRELRLGIRKYVDEYNCGRPRQSLKYKRPHQVYNEVFAAV
ncbi:MAG: integrase core domain-containing protein [Eubacteriaceae bacterium]|nr:integrase core domain-containing protein [Eubacteriaceae bacterium]